MYLAYYYGKAHTWSGICWLPRPKMLDVFLLNIWIVLLSPGVVSSHANTPSNGHCFCQAQVLRLCLSSTCSSLHKAQMFKTTCHIYTQVFFENPEKLCDNNILDCERQVFVRVLFSPCLGVWIRCGYVCRNSFPIFQEVPFSATENFPRSHC